MKTVLAVVVYVAAGAWLAAHDPLASDPVQVAVAGALYVPARVFVLFVAGPWWVVRWVGGRVRREG